MAKTEAQRRLAGLGMMIAAVSVFAYTDAVAKLLTRDYSPLLIVWARYFFQMIVMIILLAPRRGMELIRSKRPRFQFWRGLVLTGSSLTFFSTLPFLPLAEVSAITFLAPLFVAVLAGPVLHERVPAASWVAIVGGLVGMLFIIRPGTDAFSWWTVLPICTALLMAAYQLMTRRIAGIDPPTTTLFYPAVVGTVVLLLVLPFVWQWPHNFWHTLGFIMLGVFGGIGHFLLIRGYERAPASLLAPFVYAQLVGTLTLGWFVFGDFPDAWGLFGITIIVGSGLLLIARQARGASTAS